jgi:hypothetical protein
MVASDDDWRLSVGHREDTRGASFVLTAWTPPPPEWVQVVRGEDGGIASVSLRRSPGFPGWTEGQCPVWDHDHCELCSQRLTDNPEYEDGQPRGWRTGEDWGSFRWVCLRCFSELRERLGWRVAGMD